MSMLEAKQVRQRAIWTEGEGMLFLRGRLVFGWMFFLVPLDLRAHNSAVECHLHTVEVVGSNPAVPTI